MSDQKGFSGMVLIILGVALIGIIYIAYLSFQKYTAYSSLQQEAIDQNKNPSPEVSENSKALPTTPESNQKSYVDLSTAWSKDLKPYTNPNLNITFKYPSSFEETVFTSEQIKSNNDYYADKIKDYEYPSYLLAIYTHPLSAEEFTKASESDPNFYMTDSENAMGINIQQFDNPNHLPLYDFIAKQYSVYGGGGREATFDEFKKNLHSTSIPFPNSYENLNSVSESPNRKIFFTAAGKIYEFSLTGGTGTGQGYSDNANNIFNNILKTVAAK